VLGVKVVILELVRFRVQGAGFSVHQGAESRVRGA
jgi:hypothetical protein